MNRYRTHQLLNTLVMFAGLLMIGWAQTAFAQGGALDPAFGTGGRFSGANNTGQGEAAVLDSSGRLVVAGFVFDSTYDDVAMIRLLPNGTLDTSFGNNGLVKTNLGQESVGQAVAIDSQGRLVVAGTIGTNGVNGNFLVARYDSSGTLDTTFNGTGTITTNFGHGNNSASAVAIDSTDRIIVAGYAFNGTDFDFALARYNDSGLDSSFNNTGTVLTDFSGRNDQANTVTIDGSGGIVMAGFSTDSNNTQAFALARYKSDGSPDTTFNTTGEVLTSFSGNARANGVAIDGSGNIVAAGVSVGTFNDFALARYQPNGALDKTFNGTGTVSTDFGGNETAHSVAIDAGGRIVAVGAFTPNGGSSTVFALARYNPDGSLDSNFGTGGKVTTSFPTGGNSTATSVQMDALQRIVVAGMDTSNAFIAARYLSASANLGITKTASGSVPATQPLAYTITVTNAGPDATLAQLTDSLPAGVTYSSASPSQGSCTFADPTVTCLLGSIADQGSATVTVNVQATGDVPTVTNTATVAGNDPDPSDNSASATTTVTAAADVSVSKTGPAAVPGGTNIRYLITVTNNGPSTANGVTVTDPLNDRFIDAIASKGPCVFAKSKGSGTLTCSLGTITIGSSATVSVTVLAPHRKGTTSNTASVTANEFDPDTTNNSSTATVTVQ